MCDWQPVWGCFDLTSGFIKYLAPAGDFADLPEPLIPLASCEISLPLSSQVFSPQGSPCLAWAATDYIRLWLPQLLYVPVFCAARTHLLKPNPQSSTGRWGLREVLPVRGLCSHERDFHPYGKKGPNDCFTSVVSEVVRYTLPLSPRNTNQESASETPILFMKEDIETKSNPGSIQCVDTW